MRMPWTKKENKRYAYHFALNDDEFTFATKIYVKSSLFLEFFNKYAKKINVVEGWGDISKPTWSLAERERGAIEKKLLKTLNFDGFVEKIRRKKGFEKFKPIYIKIEKVEYQKRGAGFDVRIEISGLQTGVE